MANELKNTGHVTLSTGEQFVLPLQDIKPSRALFKQVSHVKIIMITVLWLFSKQFTWIPNELIGFNFILFESLDRFNNPKGIIIV